MKYIVADRFWKSFSALPLPIQKIAEGKFEFFTKDPHHPSLRTRKMEGKEDVWEGHITTGYVFTFRYNTRGNETVVESLDIGKHDVVYKRA